MASTLNVTIMDRLDDMSLIYDEPNLILSPVSCTPIVECAVAALHARFLLLNSPSTQSRPHQRDAQQRQEVPNEAGNTTYK